jgi:hypothetical protein
MSSYGYPSAKAGLIEEKEAVDYLNKALRDGAISLAEYQTDISKANQNIKSYTTALTQNDASVKLLQTSVKSFSTVVTSFNAAFAAAADLWYNNIDQLVALYKAQINVISSQNTYTQALALQAEATTIYGKNSEQASRATTAANYVGALYTQSKKNEVVAQMNYYTATAQNLATISTSFIQMAEALGILQLAQTGMVAASIADASLLEIAAIPIAGALIAGGLTAYELATQKAPTLAAPSMQGGGYVGRTGSYFLHQGETVVSNAQSATSGMSPVTININASSNVDLARVRQEVESALATTMLRSQKQRGVY